MPKGGQKSCSGGGKLLRSSTLLIIFIYILIIILYAILNIIILVENCGHTIIMNMIRGGPHHPKVPLLFDAAPYLIIILQAYFVAVLTGLGSIAKMRRSMLLKRQHSQV